jgi:hypothetical protein
MAPVPTQLGSTQESWYSLMELLDERDAATAEEHVTAIGCGKGPPALGGLLAPESGPGELL